MPKPTAKPRGRAADDHPAAMTGEQFMTALKRLGFHKESGQPSDTGLSAAARFFGYHPRPVREWPIEGPPAGVAIALKLMLKMKLNAADAMELLR